MLVLINFPPARDIRSLSPFCYKAEALLALAGCDFRMEPTTDLAALPHGKVPVLKDGDLVIPDSSLIQRHLERHHGLAVDETLTGVELAMAEAFRRMTEEHLRWSMVHARWVDPAGEKMILSTALTGVPEDMRRNVLNARRESVSRTLQAQGLGRHTPEEIYRFGCMSLDAIATFLDDKAFLMGDRPTTVDASVVGVVLNILASDIDTTLMRHAAAIPTLADYVLRFERTVFGPAARIPATLRGEQAA